MMRFSAVTRYRALLFHVLLIGLFAGLPLSSFAQSLDLDSARRSGQLGEAMTGYVIPLEGANAQAQALATRINAERRSTYEQIANRNGQPLGVVEKLAAERIREKLSAGSRYQNEQGVWLQR